MVRHPEVGLGLLLVTVVLTVRTVDIALDLMAVGGTGIALADL
jgi:hypothetical protein